jgi:hypothetical protein
MAVMEYLSERYQAADRPLRRASASNAFIGIAPRYLIEAVAMSLIAALGDSTGTPRARFKPDCAGARDFGLRRKSPFAGSTAMFWRDHCYCGGQRFLCGRVIEALQRPVDPVRLQPPPLPLPLEQALTLEHIWFRYGEGRTGFFKICPCKFRQSDCRVCG